MCCVNSLLFSGFFVYSILQCRAGLLKIGRPLPFELARPHLHYVREHGVRQFVHTYNRVSKDHLQDADLKWGDEVEYGIFRLNRANRTVALSLRGAEVMEKLCYRESQEQRCLGANWMPEYGSWMVESTPHVPYSGYTEDLLNVEKNMRLRRTRLKSVLDEGEIAPTVTNFPLLGVPGTFPSHLKLMGPIANSRLIPDELINPHPRFGALTANIRKRRGENVRIQVPLFKDRFTQEYKAQKAPCIEMDAMAFGMGSCCLQLTFQARNLEESRYMYDQLAVLAPIMLALTAATPIHHGRLAATDVRWSSIAQSVDDRTPAELGIGPQTPDGDLAGEGITPMPKSRYDSISCFIYQCEKFGHRAPFTSKYNDIKCPTDKNSYSVLRTAGVDHGLSYHVAHLFTRDPLVIFDDSIFIDDEAASDHWDNIQSTNWQTVRWKPPPTKKSPDDPDIGWRVELRSMEVQLTDFENAAYVVFIVLLTRVLLAFDLNLYIPISKVDANMKRAHGMDAVLNEKFYFRKIIAVDQEDCDGNFVSQDFSICGCDKCEEITEMSVQEILMGKDDHMVFPGLIPLIYAYLDHIKCPAATATKISRYLQYIEKRATGELMTTATYLRKFVQGHPSYAEDSVISQEIAYDLLTLCSEIGEGLTPCPELLGKETIRPLNLDDAWQIPLLSKKLSVAEKDNLLQYTKRASFSDRIAHSTHLQV